MKGVDRPIGATDDKSTLDGADRERREAIGRGAVDAVRGEMPGQGSAPRPEEAEWSGA
ncbi:hypothetical protein Misp01_66250 [Microtetraspora sp. NBRC 13810]|uniref:hypothetical protein n=1 Tax=Microtetraspora sp. NBRC 13810 TaxID=3030990 RepID=UPI0024A2A05A|nr:hypothetical protein [Microtetraspora sp. NBRC 13810]GLW11497.1 hypothetical protein Misp01_66250 [Microtetraspora sp. NBRC 13810]